MPDLLHSSSGPKGLNVSDTGRNKFTSHYWHAGAASTSGTDIQPTDVPIYAPSLSVANSLVVWQLQQLQYELCLFENNNNVDTMMGSLINQSNLAALTPSGRAKLSGSANVDNATTLGGSVADYYRLIVASNGVNEIYWTHFSYSVSTTSGFPVVQLMYSTTPSGGIPLGSAYTTGGVPSLAIASSLSTANPNTNCNLWMVPITVELNY